MLGCKSRISKGVWSRERSLGSVERGVCEEHDRAGVSSPRGGVGGRQRAWRAVLCWYWPDLVLDLVPHVVFDLVPSPVLDLEPWVREAPVVPYWWAVYIHTRLHQAHIPSLMQYLGHPWAGLVSPLTCISSPRDTTAGTGAAGTAALLPSRSGDSCRKWTPCCCFMFPSRLCWKIHICAEAMGRCK